MTLLKITPEDLKNVLQILNADIGIEAHQKKYFDENKWEIEYFYIVIDELNRHESKFDKLNDYFIKNKNFDLIKLVEHKLINGLPYQSKQLNYFKKRLNDYYPENDNIFCQILKKQKDHTVADFNNLIDIALLCKNDKISAGLFVEKIIKKNSFDPLDLINIEKIKKLWNKRFLKTDVKYEDYKILEDLFKKTNPDNKNYIEKILGYYVSFEINFDLLSHQLNCSMKNIKQQYFVFFNSFGNFLIINMNDDYIKKLSIKEFKNDNHIIFNYNDESKKQLLENIGTLLIDEMIANKTPHRDSLDKFFKPFLTKIIIDYELNNDSDKKEIKKNKI